MRKNDGGPYVAVSAKKEIILCSLALSSYPNFSF